MLFHLRNKNSWTTKISILCTDQRDSKMSFNKSYSLKIWPIPFLSDLHRKMFQKCIRFLSKQNFTRGNKRCKVPSPLEVGLQILLLLFILGRFYETGRFTSKKPDWHHRCEYLWCNHCFYPRSLFWGDHLDQSWFHSASLFEIQWTFCFHLSLHYYDMGLCAFHRPHWRVRIFAG